jgi:hypothetical protein
MSSKDSDLLNAIKKLRTSIDEMNRKTPTPLDINAIADDAAIQYEFYHLGPTDTIPAAVSWALCYDDGGHYYYVDINKVMMTYPGAPVATTVATAAFNLKAIAYDREHSWIIVGENSHLAGATGRVNTYNTNGTLLYSKNVFNPVPGGSPISIIALAYDGTDSIIYILYYYVEVGGNLVTRIGMLDPETGRISSYQNVPDLFYNADDMEYKDGLLFILHISSNKFYTLSVADMSTRMIALCRVFPGTAVSAGGLCYNGDLRLWVFSSGETVFRISRLIYVQKMSINDDDDTSVTVDGNVQVYGGPVTVDDGGGSITVDGAVSTTPVTSSNINYGNVMVGIAAGLIIAANANRESVEIFNAHTANILYVGDDNAVTMAIGRPVYPLCSVSFDGYTGDVWGIANAINTDVRFTELE